MDTFLAELYGTNQDIGASSGGEDVQKLAEARILGELCESEKINVDELEAPTIVKLAQELFGDESALAKAAQEGEPPPPPKAKEAKKCEKCGEEDCKCPAAKEASESFEEKMAMADRAGRVMAHAFWQEKGLIEKTAEKAPEAKPEAKPEETATPEKTASAEPASALDVLAERWAMSKLAEAGLVKNEEEETAEQKLAAAIERRGMEMLREAGYIQE
jgi:hypothetical protein